MLTNNEVEVLTQSGMIHYKAREFGAAIADFTKVLRANPRIDTAWYHRGCAWYNKGDTARARADFEVAARLAPDNTVYQDALAKTEGSAKIENPFFSFSKPYLDFLAKGTIFNSVYFGMAAINALLPFVIIFSATFKYAQYAEDVDAGIKNDIGIKYVIVFILAWLVIVFACWIGFQLWLDRRKKVASVISISTEFIATLIFSDLIQTFGEWLGTCTGIVGAGVALIASIFFGKEANSFFAWLGMNSIHLGALGTMTIIIGPLVGVFIIMLSRFLAELLRLWASMVNNTKEIAANIKK